MAIQDKDTIITNLVATPRTPNDLGLRVMKAFATTFELSDNANADTAVCGDAIPVNARVLHIYVATDDLGTAGTIDIGLAKKNADDTFTVVDADCIANNLDVNAAAVAMTDRRFSALDINTCGQKLWQLAGLSADPGYSSLYLFLTCDTGTTAAGTVSVILECIS